MYVSIAVKNVRMLSRYLWDGSVLIKKETNELVRGYLSNISSCR